MLCLKGLGQAPARYLAGIGIGYKMKISRYKALNQVLVLAETMIGICRVTRLRTLMQESEIAHSSKECITIWARSLTNMRLSISYNL